jgi:hypothetical protein
METKRELIPEPPVLIDVNVQKLENLKQSWLELRRNSYCTYALDWKLPYGSFENQIIVKSAEYRKSNALYTKQSRTIVLQMWKTLFSINNVDILSSWIVDYLDQRTKFILKWRAQPNFFTTYDPPVPILFSDDTIPNNINQFWSKLSPVAIRSVYDYLTVVERFKDDQLNKYFPGLLEHKGNIK